MDKIELNKVTVELLALDLLLVTIKDGVTIEKEDIYKIKKHNLELTKGNEYAVVFDTGYYTSISNEARALMASKAIEQNRKASAFVINSLSQKLLGNFYVKMNKPTTPTKFFSDKKKALEWVKKIINQ